jgi:hypothetical protein
MADVGGYLAFLDGEVLRDEGDPADAEEETTVTIAHGFEGACEACGKLVDVGDRVHQYADDVVVHERCPTSRERAQA